jgi:glyoxylase-like metal-dependent hydrolase (beta-lactamase superfamily II)
MTEGIAAIEQIARQVEGVNAPLGSIQVRALLVYGDRYTLLIDTLSTPSELTAVREAVQQRGLPLWIVNSHADWDHWWGNSAFPDAPIIALRSTRTRQLREGKRTLTSFRKRDERFNEVELRPATIAFEDRLDLDLGGITVELHPVPGHTHDTLVAWIPERKLLFAADAAEDPIPLINEGPVGDWPQRLRSWAERAKVVVPAHGPVQGPELLTRNAAYLQGLFAAPDRQPPELEDADDFYRRSHRGNLKKAAAEKS